jgi:hypothetical protein
MAIEVQAVRGRAVEVEVRDADAVPGDRPGRRDHRHASVAVRSVAGVPEAQQRRRETAEKERCEMTISAKHTPGPWQADGGHDYDDWPMTTILVFDDSQGSICEVYAHTDCETLLANACLIAAAPDLLAACKTALGILRELPVSSAAAQYGGDYALADLTAAIAKAESHAHGPKIGDVTEALNELRDAGLKAWDDIADPEAFIRDLRGDGDHDPKTP